METIHALTELFRKFPGIGPKQARRFVYYLLSEDRASLDRLTRLISSLKSEIALCDECCRFFPLPSRAGVTRCATCASLTRDTTHLMIVSKDADYEIIEKSGSWNGTYFVLGGSIPILEKEPEKRIRKDALYALIKRRLQSSPPLKEVVLALNANPEGEYTGDFVRSLLNPLLEPQGVRISVLGRGLSTGAELEYADGETIKSALKNRF